MSAAVIAIDLLLATMTVPVPVPVPVIAGVVHWLLSLLPLHAFSPSPLDADDRRWLPSSRRPS